MVVFSYVLRVGLELTTDRRELPVASSRVQSLAVAVGVYSVSGAKMTRFKS